MDGSQAVIVLHSKGLLLFFFFFFLLNAGDMLLCMPVTLCSGSLPEA